ncbi:DUF221-domain-containing protein [Neolentinus lepideus HHB14362 ss-1]|uniref:DUF221-domain-containing protein n=1 Tax=Neolentinus lepideus HHB14362 ss-1 TaxID=1314782 RepID=A0A165PT15_9AGAM|nr:DUF221-domain-containing protein [Neolentinus lepideus HHB14362 ss-1]
MLKDKRPKGTIVTLAPNPKDIIWSNITKSPGEVARLRMIGFLVLAVVCFFNTVPLFAISILANLSSISTYVPFLKAWADNSETSFAIISGVLPPTVSAFFGYFLPVLMRWLTRYMGAHTHSRLDRAVVARYFAFLVISQLVVFTLIGVAFKSISQVVVLIGEHKSFSDIISNLKSLPGTINQTYISQSSYWLTFFPLRAFLAVFDLAQILNLVWTTFKTHVFGRTPRDIRDWTRPPDFEYAIYYSNILFMACVGFVFAPLAPLVAAAAAIVFWVSSWVYKYQLMFVFVSQVETGGRLWNPVINRILASVVLMQALMTLTMGLQMGWSSFHWVATLPPILFLLIFKIYLNRTFDRQFRYYIPTEEELRLAKVHSSRGDTQGNRLEKRFGHPALHSELFTPMLHARMMPLLSQVYAGKIANDKAQMAEYGGQTMDTQLVSGIKIAGIDQTNLDYDLALYQRDRGELDWDQRSIATTHLLGGDASLHPSKSTFYAGGRSSPAPSMAGVGARDRYMAQGPSRLATPANEIELSRFDPTQDQQPLLAAPQQMGYFDPRMQSSASLASYPGYPSPDEVPPLPQYPPQYPPPPHHPAEGYRMAPVHRPYASTPSNDNIAGRGTFNRGYSAG